MNDDGVIDWDRPLIVGMGASAGGLIAYETFLAWMPPDSGMALVLVQHLDPNHLFSNSFSHRNKPLWKIEPEKMAATIAAAISCHSVSSAYG